MGNNEITEVCLGAMPQLRLLTCNNNQVATLAGFANNAASLEQLDLSSNAVESVQELAHLQGLTKLQSLSLVENPVTGADKYRNHVHAILPQLATLDGEPFSDEDREPPPAPEPPAE